MIAERRINEATANLHEYVAGRTIPSPPEPSASPERTGRLVLALAMVAIVAGGSWWLLDRESTDELVVSSPAGVEGIIPLETGGPWVYEVTDVAADRRLDDLVVELDPAVVSTTPSGELGWPIALFEPWRSPGACSENASVRLPTRAQIELPGETTQEIRARCEGLDVVGAARVSWDDAETVSVPAGTFTTVRVDISVAGFVDPFPVSVSLWIDSDVGVVRHEAVGTAPGPERHTRAELVRGP